MSHPTNCVTCGAPLTGKQRKYCSRSCQDHNPSRYDTARRHAQYKKTGYGRRTCEVCGAEYVATYPKQRTCGRVCGLAIKTGVNHYLCDPAFSPYQSFLIWRSCRACGDAIVVNPCGASRQYCRKCECTQHLGGTWRQGVKVCSDCGVPIPVYKGSGNYCVTCGERRIRAARLIYMRSVPKNARQRARKYGCDYESVNKRKVYERDNYVCHICGRKTKRSARWEVVSPDPRYPTLDHLVPMSLGGAHSYANVACACFECNCLKSAGCTEEQLLLFGTC